MSIAKHLRHITKNLHRLKIKQRDELTKSLLGNRAERAILYLLMLENEKEVITRAWLQEKQSYTLSHHTAWQLQNIEHLQLTPLGKRANGHELMRYQLTDEGKKMAEKISASLSKLIASYSSQPASQPA